MSDQILNMSDHFETPGHFVLVSEKVIMSTDSLLKKKKAVCTTPVHPNKQL